MKRIPHRSLWQWLLLVLALGLLWLTLRSVPLADVWAQLRQLRPGDLLLLVVANVLVLATFSARWWILLYAQGYRLPFHKLIGYRLATFAVSYFTPGPHFGGEPLQVYLVTRRHGVPTAVSLTAVVLDKLIEMLFNFTFVVLGALLVLDWQTGFAGAQVWSTLGFGALFLLPVAILGALAAGRHPLSRPLAALLHAREHLRRSSVRSNVRSNVRSSSNGPAVVSTHSRMGHFVLTLRESEDLGSRLFRQRPGLLAAAVAVTVISWLAIVGEFWLMTHVLGLGLTLPDALVALLAARAAILLPLPAAVGALEASQALAMVSLGLPAAYGISLSLLIRGRDVLLGLIGLGLSTAYLHPGPAKPAN
jgi:uncharacterized protein (TIRG00374 family)